MWLHSSKRASLFSVWWRMTLDMPHTMPWVNQLVMICFDTPEASSRSPSVEVMEREMTRSFLRARISAQIMANGVRDVMQPPMPTWSPSRTSLAASSSDMTFSRRPRSRSSRLRAQLPRRVYTELSCAHPAFSIHRRRSRSRGHAAVAVEGGDHLVPLRHEIMQAAPEFLASGADRNRRARTPCCSTHVK